MRVLDIAERVITVTLDPEDCATLAVACRGAADVGAVPAHQLYGALTAALELAAAGLTYDRVSDPYGLAFDVAGLLREVASHGRVSTGYACADCAG